MDRHPVTVLLASSSSKTAHLSQRTYASSLDGIVSVVAVDCRRTLAGDLLDRGVDISTVSRMLGHAQIGTTARYDRRPEEAKRRAATTIHIPYRRRHG